MQHMALLHSSVSYKDTDSQHLWRNVGIWKSALQKNHLGLVYTMHKSAMIIVMEYKLKEQKKKKIRILQNSPISRFHAIKT